MKKILFTAFILASSVLSFSCSKDEIPFFTDDRYIYIDAEEGENSTGEGYTMYPFTFMSIPGDEATIAIPLTMSGRELTADTPYTVTVNSRLSTLEKTEYEILPTIFHKAHIFNDTLYVKLFKSARMDSEILYLALSLTSDENFKALTSGKTDILIEVSNQISRPSWWRGDADNYLGDYSPIKYMLFLQYGGGSEVGDFGQLDSSSKRAAALRFKYALEELKNTPGAWQEEWGNPDDIVVPIPG